MSPLLNNFAAAAKQDPKKAGVLGVLALLLVAMGLRLWLRQEPSSAAASSPPRLLANGAATAVAGGGRLRVPSLNQAAAVLRHWREMSPPHLSRNPFVSDLFADAAPVPAKAPVAAPAVPAAADEGLFWQQLDRALATRDEREQYRSKMSDAALGDAANLPLTSIVSGSDPRALVGGRLVRPGDQVPSAAGPFVVEAVEPRRVVLRRDGVRVELLLGRAKPKLAGI